MVKKFSLMVILTAILTLGIGTNGYTGGSLEPGGAEHGVGPSIRGTLTEVLLGIDDKGTPEVPEDDEAILNIDYTGKCGGQDFAFNKNIMKNLLVFLASTAETLRGDFLLGVDGTPLELTFGGFAQGGEQEGNMSLMLYLLA